MTDILHRVGIRAPLPLVHRALTSIEGLSGWWTKDTSGSAGVGGTIAFRFKNPQGELLGEMQMSVQTPAHPEQVRWRCKSGPEEWVGTDLTYDLKQEGEYTIVLFGHRGWKEEVEFTAHCCTKWAVFLMSLKRLVETGQGQPSPDDVKIDNWN